MMRNTLKKQLMVLVCGATMFATSSCMVDQSTAQAIAALTTEAVQAGLNTYLDLAQQAQAMP